MKIKAILFDMDGVLVDAKEWHYHALNEALTAKGYEPISRQDHLTIFDGLPTAVKLSRHKSTAKLSKEEQAEINNLKQQLVIQLAEQFCTENPAHTQALRLLKEEGYKLAVCSNSIRDFVGKMMDKTRLNAYLSFFLSNQDVAAPKPSPEIYQTAINRLGLSPGECIICEDNQHGIAAARASGAHVFEVKSISDVCYQNLKKFIEYIDGGAKHENGQSAKHGEGLVRRQFSTHDTKNK